MIKKKLIASIGVFLILYLPKNSLGQEAKLFSPMPGILFVQETDSVGMIAERTADQKKSLIEKFKYEREQYHFGRRTKVKFYNPVTIFYRLLGI